MAVAGDDLHGEGFYPFGWGWFVAVLVRGGDGDLAGVVAAPGKH